MRILVISQYYPPDITAAAFRIGDLVHYLVQQKAEVIAVVGHPHKGVIHSNDTPVSGEDASVIKISISDHSGGGVLSYIRHYLSFAIGALIRCCQYDIRKFSPAVIFVTSPPLFVGLTGLVLAKLLKSKLVLDVRDIWPDSAVAVGQIKSMSLLWYCGKWLEKFLYRHAHLITPVTKTMGRYIRSEGGRSIFPVYNGVPNSSVIVRYEDKAKFIKSLVYVGNLGRAQGLDLIVKCFASVKPKNWQLLLYGTGAMKGVLENLIHELDCADTIHLGGLLSREEAERAMGEADILYLSIIDHPVFALTIPSKVFDYLRAERPIIAALTGEAAEILSRSKANIVIPPGNTTSLTAQLMQLDEVLAKNTNFTNDNTQNIGQYQREAIYSGLYKQLEKLIMEEI